MIGSTTPLAKRPDCHPVHQANALLRAALLNPASPSNPAEERQNVESLSRAIRSVMQGLPPISFPTSLAERLEALDANDALAAFAPLKRGAPIRRDPLPERIVHRPLLSASDALSAEAHGLLPADSEPARDAARDGLDYDDDDVIDDATLAPLPQTVPQIHMQALLEEFRRRQRNANLLVAGSIAMAVLLTLGCLMMVANLAAARPAGDHNRPSLHSTSRAWRQPNIGIEPVSTNSTAKAAALPVAAPAEAALFRASDVESAPQVILATSGREIALAPLLPSNHAGYLLLRGLPREAKLSAGRQSESGAWLVKADYVPDLTLATGEAAPGDYPIEVYVLQSGDGPQARHSFVLRVEAPARTYPVVGPDMGWASAFPDVLPAAPAARPAEETSAPAEARVLRERAKRLLDEGDIAAARLLLLHLAERGEGEAAYDLARTFDRDMLAALGARGVDADPVSARDWYERASQRGNAQATERLKILASLSGTDPSD